MAETLSTGAIGVDIQPLLDQLSLAQRATQQLANQVNAAADTTSKRFTEAAESATVYSNRLAAVTAEQRAARDATASARDALRELTQQQKALTVAQSKSGIPTAEYQRLQKLLEQNRVEIQKAKQAISENKAATDQERAAVERLRDTHRQATNEIKLETAATKDAAAAAKEQADASKKGVESGGSVLDGLAGKVGVAAAGLFAVDKVTEYLGKVREVTAEFQKYEITLTGAFDGDKDRAQRALVQVQMFADAQGLEVTALTDTYVKLVNRGIIPTTNQLRQLSDIAATSGKSTDQFVEALLDAQTGEFERLKEFGIKVKNNGDTIVFSFRGVKQEVQNTQEAISQYLFALGDQNGVQGQAAAQLKSLGGAAADSKNALTELYLVLGERAKGAFAGFSSIVATAARGLASFFKSADRMALEQSAAGIDKYGQLVGARFTQVAADAKAAGKNVTEALKQASDDQLKFIDSKLNKANRDLTAFQISTGETGVADPYTEGRLKAAVKLYEGQKKAAQQAYQAAVDGGKAEEDQVGRIAALRKKIAAEEKAREATTDTDAGNKERVRLNAQIDADNKLLQELLGKVDKAARAQSDKLAAALRALQQERATLQGLAVKAAIKESDDLATQARLSFEESLRQVGIIQAKLVEREAAVRKAGGRGSNADGVIDGVQDQQLATLRIAALDKYYTDLYKISEAREQRLFDLRVGSDAKELEAIDRKYDKQLRLAKDAIERQAVEEARAREQQALKAQQQQRILDQNKSIGDSTAQTVGQIFGAGTGISKIEAEKNQQKQLLENQRKYLQDSLNLTLLKTGKEAEAERAALAAQLAGVENQQKELNRFRTSDFSIYKLLFGENDSQELRGALDAVTNTVVSSLSQIVQAQGQAAADRANNATQSINELSSQLSAEIELHKQGSASNIQGLQNEIKEQRAIRRQALEDQRTAAKEQVIIDTITQVSSIVTASAKVFDAFASIPFVGIPLGIAAVATLVGAFAASKVSAYNAASNIGQGFFKGGYTGGSDEKEERGVVHGKEFVHTAEKTREYRPLFEAIHAGRPEGIDWSSPKLAALLPDYALPGQLKAEKQQAQQMRVEHSFSPMRQEFAQMHERLGAIERTNQQMADRREVIPTAKGHRLVDPVTGSSHDIELHP